MTEGNHPEAGAAQRAPGGGAGERRRYPRVARKRPGGRCNICLKRQKLTEDHVPPLCCWREPEVLLHGFGKRIEAETGQISQSGIRFETICAVCNNDRLGKYDYCLKEFGDVLARFFESSLTLERRISITCRPRMMLHCIAGHLLAARTEIVAAHKIDALLRRCVLNPLRPFPEQLHVYHWPFPHRSVHVARDLGMPVHRRMDRWGEGVGIFSVLKFHPVAFLLTDAPSYQNLPSLDRFRRAPFDTVADVAFSTRILRASDWPEAPSDDGNIILTNSTIYADAVVATPRRRGPSR